jgi:formate hydrogenlyase subunit 3/multisubunit Na+/H+ antiporter MnhD subunit
MAGSEAPTKRSGVRETISFVGWHLIMVAWFAGWLLGIVWVWPAIARLELNVDLVSAIFWLVTGAVTWIVAFSMGYRRYWQA